MIDIHLNITGIILYLFIFKKMYCCGNSTKSISKTDYLDGIRGVQKIIIVGSRTSGQHYGGLAGE